MSKAPTYEKLKSEGILLDSRSGSTWNDGGHWFRWIYQLDERYWEVYQPTDYRPDVEIYEMVQKKKVITSYQRMTIKDYFLE